MRPRPRVAVARLFEQITELPEYYPTRAEGELLADIAAEIMESVQPVQIVELGSGSSTKTRLLLDTPTAQRVRVTTRTPILPPP